MALTPTFKIKTQPTLEPVTVSEFADHARIDGDDEALLANGMLIRARQCVESDSGVTLMPTVWQGLWDRFPCGDEPSELRLMRGPVSAIASIQYVDAAGATQSWTDYRADIYRTPARITPVFGGAYPTAQEIVNAVIVEFTAGYASSSAVPQIAKGAIFLLAAHWFRNRESTVIGSITKEIELSYRSLVDALHWMEFDE